VRNPGARPQLPAGASVRDRLSGGLILVAGGWLRLREISWTRFTADQANVLGAVRNLVRYGRWPTLGPDVGPGFWQWGHLGPPHFYLIAPAFWASGGLPEACVAFLALLHVLGIACVIRAGNRFIAPGAGLGAGLLLAVAPYPVFVARELVNFAFVPPVVALMTLATLEAAVAGRMAWLAIALPCAAFLVQVHASTWALVPLPAFALLGVRRRWGRLALGLALGGAGAIVVLGPYLWGQTRTHFADFRLFVQAATGGQAAAPEVPFPNLDGLRFAVHILDAMPHDPYRSVPGEALASTLMMLLVVGGALSAAVAVARAARARRVSIESVTSLVLLAGFFAVPALLTRFGHELYHRHVVGASPFAALLAALAVRSVTELLPPSIRLVPAVAVIALGAALGWRTLDYQEAVVAEHRIAGGIPLVDQARLARALTVEGALRWNSAERLRMPGLDDSRYGVRYLIEDYAARTVSEPSGPMRPRMAFTVIDRGTVRPGSAPTNALILNAWGRYEIAAAPSPILRQGVAIQLAGSAPIATGLPWSARTTAERAELVLSGARTHSAAPETWIVTSNGCVDGIWLGETRVHASRCAGAPASLPWPRAEGFVLPPVSDTLRLTLLHRGGEFWVDLSELPFVPATDPNAPAALARWGEIPIHRPDSTPSTPASDAPAEPRYLR